MICSGWIVFGVTMKTASTLPVGQQVLVALVDPGDAERVLRPARSSASGLHAATSETPGTRHARFSACRRPMRPSADDPARASMLI